MSNFLSHIQQLKDAEHLLSQPTGAYILPDFIPYELAHYLLGKPEYKDVLLRYGQNPTRAGYDLMSPEEQRIAILEHQVKLLIAHVKYLTPIGANNLDL